MENEKLLNTHLNVVVLLIFRHTGLQPIVVGDLDFYTKTFDFEMLTASYFINKTKHTKNKQTKLESNQSNHVCESHMAHWPPIWTSA